MKWLLQIAFLPYFLMVLIACLIWLTVLYPLSTLTICSVTNNTTETLSITPIGTVGSKGYRTLLTLHRASFPFFVESKLGDFKLEPNETFRFGYVKKNVELSEIVVENASQEMRRMVVNSDPTENPNPTETPIPTETPDPMETQDVLPEVIDYPIDEFKFLSQAPENVCDTALLGRQTNRTWVVYFVSGIVLAIELLRLSFFSSSTESSEIQVKEAT